MNSVERWVYDRVQYSPFLKNFLVFVYRGILGFMPGKPIISQREVLVRPGYFFGFHDKTPWSFDNQYLLAHQFNISSSKVSLGNKIKLGFFEGPGWTHFVPVGQTTAWNWQTGAMLQWLGATMRFIANDQEGNCHVSKIFGMRGHEETIPYPIGAIDREGHLALSYSFNRLRIAGRGYGYAAGNESDMGNDTTKKAWLRLLNLRLGSDYCLFCLKEITDCLPEGTMKNSYHFFSHCLFSPSGKRFLFLHCWVTRNKNLYNRMFSANIDGSHLHVFPTSGKISHIAWIDNEKILAYARTSEGECYVVFKDKSDDITCLNKLDLPSDGHPQVFGSRYVLTDTYPDGFRYQRLILFDLFLGKRKDLAWVRSPFSYLHSIAGGAKCDLHPRWDRTGNNVCFDSAHTGIRSLCTMNIGAVENSFNL